MKTAEEYYRYYFRVSKLPHSRVMLSIDEIIGLMVGYADQFQFAGTTEPQPKGRLTDRIKQWLIDIF
jgi:hypothetical protein